MPLDSENYYDILELSNGMTFKMPVSRIALSSTTCTLSIFPENYAFEEIEAVFRNPKNLIRIQHRDNESDYIYDTLENYTILTNIGKLYDENLYTTYDKITGNPIIYQGDIISISLRKPTMDDRVPSFEANLEYLAIMSGIDLDEE